MIYRREKEPNWRLMIGTISVGIVATAVGGWFVASNDPKSSVVYPYQLSEYPASIKDNLVNLQREFTSNCTKQAILTDILERRDELIESIGCLPDAEQWECKDIKSASFHKNEPVLCYYTENDYRKAYK